MAKAPPPLVASLDLGTTNRVVSDPLSSTFLKSAHVLSLRVLSRQYFFLFMCFCCAPASWTQQCIRTHYEKKKKYSESFKRFQRIRLHSPVEQQRWTTELQLEFCACCSPTSCRGRQSHKNVNAEEPHGWTSRRDPVMTIEWEQRPPNLVNSIHSGALGGYQNFNGRFGLYDATKSQPATKISSASRKRKRDLIKKKRERLAVRFFPSLHCSVHFLRNLTGQSKLFQDVVTINISN